MNGAKAAESLGSARLLSVLSDAARARLVTKVRWIKISAGETIVPHLERRRSVYFLIEGSCHARMTGASGRTLSVRRLEAGAHFGEIAALTGAPRTVEVVAETDAVLAECPQDYFETMLDTEPALAKALAKELAHTIISLTDRLFEATTLEVRYRLYAELLRLAHGAHATPDGVLISPTREALAHAIGSQRETISRELSYLESEGILSRRRDHTILVHDAAKLLALTQSRGGVTASQMLEWQHAQNSGDGGDDRS